MRKPILNEFSDHLWFEADENIVTVGITEDGAQILGPISQVNLPRENETVDSEDQVGDIEGDGDVINLLSPVAGLVIETNSDLEDSPDLVIEDPLGAGWLFKIEAEDPAKIEQLIKKIKAQEESDDDEDDDKGDNSDDESDDGSKEEGGET